MKVLVYRDICSILSETNIKWQLKTGRDSFLRYHIELSPTIKGLKIGTQYATFASNPTKHFNFPIICIQGFMLWEWVGNTLSGLTECGASVHSEPEGTQAGLGQRENERLLRSEY